MPDVIRFGSVYVPQHDDCAEVVERIVAEGNARQFRTQGALLRYLTASLQAEGLTVASISMLRNRRHRDRQRQASYSSARC